MRAHDIHLGWVYTDGRENRRVIAMTAESIIPSRLTWAKVNRAGLMIDGPHTCSKDTFAQWAKEGYAQG
jgi:hypothetical protein